MMFNVFFHNLDIIYQYQSISIIIIHNQSFHILYYNILYTSLYIYIQYVHSISFISSIVFIYFHKLSQCFCSFHALSCIKAVIIRALMRVKFVQVVIEQPESSTMFSLPMWVTVSRELRFENVGTYMGCFGHFMVKPTTLIGSLTYLSWYLDSQFNTIHPTNSDDFYWFLFLFSPCQLNHALIIIHVRPRFPQYAILCLRLGRSLNKKKKEALRKKVAINLAKLEKKMGRKLSLVNKCLGSERRVMN